MEPPNLPKGIQTNVIKSNEETQSAALHKTEKRKMNMVVFYDLYRADLCT